MKRKLRLKRVCRLVFILVPFVLGFAAYIVYYRLNGSLTYPVLTAFYSALRLYTMSFDAGSGIAGHTLLNCVLELARYWALLVTGSALFSVLRPYFSDILTRSAARRKNSLALHGSPLNVAALNKSAKGYRVIAGNDSAERFGAKTHIIAFDSDSESLKYLSAHYDELCRDPETKVCLCAHSDKLGILTDSRVHISYIAENCARLFWDRHYIHRFDRPCEGPVRVILIGFGDYAEAILKQALLVNVFLPGTPGVEYHVFGNGDGFVARHPQLPRILEPSDRLYFHPFDEYLSSKELMEGAERIVIADDDDLVNAEVLTALCTACTALPHIYVRATDRTAFEALYRVPQGASLRPGDVLYGVGFDVFGTYDELYTTDMIIGRRMEQSGRSLHEMYAKGAGTNEAWDSIGTFMQHSNYASADHWPVKLRQVLQRDCGVDRDTLAEYVKAFDAGSRLEKYRDAWCVMEHERWCRFHYMWGWRYGEAKDRAARVHNDLVRFASMKEARDLGIEPERDLDSYEVLRRIGL